MTMPTPPDFTFNKEQQSDLRLAIKAYFLDELAMEIGDLQADLLVAFFTTHVGKQLYNLGVAESIGPLKRKLKIWFC